MIPLGQEESQTLEFKGRDALKNLSIIARSVVAMLNAEGGEIWIGLGESSGRAVEVQLIASPEKERDRVWNHLVDTIEPPPLVEEIVLEIVPAEGGAVLRIDARPQEGRRPYALLKEGGLLLMVRAGARIRAMTRDEMLAPRKRTAKQSDGSRELFQVLEKVREELLRKKQPTFWIRLQPDRDLGIDIQSRKLERYLRDPTLSGNRASGWTFANPYIELRIEQNRRVLAHPEWGSTSVERSGALEHRAPLSELALSGPQRDPQEIVPWALLEKIVSIFRLARAMYRDPELNSEETPRSSSKKKRGAEITKSLSRLVFLDFQVGVDVALVSSQGWKLRAYSPKSHGYLLKHHEEEVPASLLLERPLLFSTNDFLASDDRCAFRVVSRIYEALGFSDEEIPSEFDRQRKILVLPE